MRFYHLLTIAMAEYRRIPIWDSRIPALTPPGGGLPPPPYSPGFWPIPPDFWAISPRVRRCQIAKPVLPGFRPPPVLKSPQKPDFGQFLACLPGVERTESAIFRATGFALVLEGQALLQGFGAPARHAGYTHFAGCV